MRTDLQEFELRQQAERIEQQRKDIMSLMRSEGCECPCEPPCECEDCDCK